MPLGYGKSHFTKEVPIIEDYCWSLLTVSFCVCEVTEHPRLQTSILWDSWDSRPDDFQICR